MGYTFKGRGILWHSETGPVKWWPLNWFWMLVANFEQERRFKLEEAEAETRAAETTTALTESVDTKPAEAPSAGPPPVEPLPVVRTAISPADAAAAAVTGGLIAEAITPQPEAGSELAPPPPPEPEHLGEPDKPDDAPKA